MRSVLVSTTNVKLRDLPNRVLAEILNSENPAEKWKEINISWKRRGKSLDPSDHISLKDPTFVNLMRQEVNLPVRFSKTKTNKVSKGLSTRQKLAIKNFKNKEVTDDELLDFLNDKPTDIIPSEFGMRTDREIKKINILKIKKRKRLKAEKQAQKRVLEKAKSKRDAHIRALDIELKHVARAVHAPRAGNHIHPQKTRNRLRRINIARRRAQNAEYTNKLISNRQRKAELRKLKRRAAKKNKPFEISPEAMDFYRMKHSIVKESSLWAHLMATTQLAEKFQLMDDSISNIMICFCNYMYQVYTSEGDIYKIISSLTALATGLGVRVSHVIHFIESCQTQIISLSRYLTRTYKEGILVTTESFNDFLNNLETVYHVFKNSAFTTNITQLAMSLVSLQFFDKNVAYKFTRFLGSPVKGTVGELLFTIYQGVRYVISFGERVIRGEKITEILMQDDPIIAFINESIRLSQLEGLTYSGIPVDGFIDVITYLRMIEDSITSGEAVKSTISKFDSRRDRMETQLRLMYVIKNRVESSLREERVPPVSIVLHGPPGIGKSEIIKIISQWHSEFHKREHSENLTFSRTLTSEYMEGYSHSTPIIHYSELGNKSEAYVRQHGCDLLPEIQSLVDSLPYSANMAFDGKGKVFMTPELILIDTNNKLMHSNIVMHDVGAFLRRFIFIEAAVLPEFKKVGGVGIDKEKSCKDPSWVLDRYNFKMTHYTPTHGAPIEEVDEVGDIFVLEKFLKGKFSEHASNQVNLTDRKADIDPWYKVPRQQVSPESWALVRHDARDYLNYGEQIMLSVFGICISLMLNAVLKYGRTICTKPPFLIIAMFILFVFFKYIFLMGFIFIGVSWYHMWDHQQLFVRPSETLKGMYEYNKGKLRYLLFEEPFNAFRNTISHSLFSLKNIMIFSGVVGIPIMLFSTLRRKKNISSEYTPEGRSTNFREQDPFSELINKFEESYDIHPNRPRKKNKDEMIWNDMIDTNLGSFINTHSAETLYGSLGNNIRVVQIAAGDSVSRQHILGVRGSYALINRHAFSGCSQVDIYISNCDTLGTFELNNAKKITVDIDKTVYMGSDLVLFDTISLQFKDLIKHMPEGDLSFKQCRGLIAGIKTTIIKEDQITLKDEINGHFEIKGGFMYTFPEHGPGMCGLPLILEVKGSSAIIGLHAGGLDDTIFGFAVPLTQEIVIRAIENLQMLHPYIPVLSRGITTEYKLEEPSTKSPFNHEPFDQIDYYGKLEGNIMLNNKTSFQKIKGTQPLIEMLDTKFIQSEFYAPPLLKPKMVNGNYISPYNNVLRKMNSHPVSVDLTLITTVIGYFSEHIIASLQSRGVTKLSPLTMEDSINGVIEDDYLRRINVTTSPGFGFSGKKSVYLPKVEGECREATAYLKDKVLQIIESYHNNVSASPINVGILKDEMRTLKKVHEGNTRMFFVSPLDYLVVARMGLAPFFALMVEHGDIFASSVGVNMHTGADKFFQELIQFSPLLWEGDYKQYDISMLPDIKRAACTVIYNVLKTLGYTDSSLDLVIGILTDCTFPYYSINLDLINKPGSTPSGYFGTAELNCLMNVIMIMLAWYSHPELKDKDFFTNVLPRTYGDDVLTAVKPNCASFFNAVYYQSFCRNSLGIDFTSSTKSSEITPFITIEKASFLKRNFVFKNSRYVAPLDINSIYKMLTWINPSKHISELDQLCASWSSALYELFLHCDELLWRKIRLIMVDILVDNYDGNLEVCLDILPTYHSLYKHFYSNGVAQE